MSSRQQVLYLLQKTQKQANWDMENDSDFQDGNHILQIQIFLDQDDSQDLYGHDSNQQSMNLVPSAQKRSPDQFGLTYNEEYDLKREKMREEEIKTHPERYRLLAYSLTQFMPIKKNKYIDRKRHILMDKETNSLICTCQKASIKKNEKTNPHLSFNCGERCINKCVSTECYSQVCPSGPFCKNRRFQLHQNANVYPAKTEKKGWGLFAGEFIPKGSFIMQYVGEIVSVDSDEGQKRVDKYKNSTCTYLMSTVNNEVIDPTFVGNIARFINHSCDPNCETQKWNVLGEVCVGIFAIKDIRENEELSFDYQFDFFKTPFTKCYCGTTKCKGYLGVLPTTDAKNQAIASDAPSCSYCNKLILEKDELIVCSGLCKHTFHISCIIHKEIKSKSSTQAFLQQLDKKNFFCKSCCQKFSGKKKRNSRSFKDNDDFLRFKAQEAANYQAALEIENLPENPQEDKDINVDVPPWLSTDPSIRKYFEDNQENRELDQIIIREFQQITEWMREQNQEDMNKGRKGKKKLGQFSQHYTFMCELQKRLKMRIKENKIGIKFRKHKDDVKASAQAKKLQREEEERRKRLKREQLLLKQQRELMLSRKRGRPKKLDSMNLGHKSQSSNPKNFDSYSISPRAQPNKRRKLSSREESKGDNLDDMTEQFDISLENIEEQESADEMNHLQIEKKAKSEVFKSEKDDDESENEIEDNEEELDEESEQEDDESEEQDEEDEQEEDEEDYEEQQDEGDDDSQVNEEVQCSQQNELNLEQMQGQIEDEDEEVQKEMTLNQSKKNLSLTNQLNDLRRESIVDRFRHLSAEDQGISSEHALSLIQTNKTPIKSVGLFSSPRKNSLTIDINQEKRKISEYARLQIEEFVNDQNSREFHVSETVVRESKFNVYDIVFNLVINPDNLDDLQCLPYKFQIYWEQSWGGMITVRMISTFKQYQFLTNLLSEASNMLQKANLLSGKYGGIVFQSSSSNNNKGKSRFNNESDIIKSHNPFEIVMIKVPKNFIRKLVGYQERQLVQFRKNFQVDFDFNRDLLTDDVFQMNETTALRIFGKAQDVFQVNEEIQKSLEKIQMKTILLQMSDCKILMDYVKEVKVMVDPCEIRVKKMIREWKDLRHPFYYLPNYFREMALIGTKEEIVEAEKKIDYFFSQKRDSFQSTQQQISFLLPVYFKTYANDIKNKILYKLPSLQIFFYEPTYPRKHLTVLIIGPWNMILQAKNILESQCNEMMNRSQSGYTFQNFQQFTYHQQIRFSFKSLKRFVLEQDIKYLNHWDMCSLFVEDAGKDFDKLRRQIKEIEKQIEIESQPKESSLSLSGFIGTSSLSIHAQSTTPFLSSIKSSLDPFSLNRSSSYNTLPPTQAVAQLQKQQSELQSILIDKENDYEQLVKFLKEQDVESCINSLFVLQNSAKEDSLVRLMKQLRVSKKEIIEYMISVLTKNIEDYEDSIRYFYGYYKYEPPRDAENDKVKTHQRQSREKSSKDRTKSHHKSKSRSRSLSNKSKHNHRNRRDQSKSRKDKSRSRSRHLRKRSRSSRSRTSRSKSRRRQKTSRHDLVQESPDFFTRPNTSSRSYHHHSRSKAYYSSSYYSSKHHRSRSRHRSRRRSHSSESRSRHYRSSYNNHSSYNNRSSYRDYDRNQICSYESNFYFSLREKKNNSSSLDQETGKKSRSSSKEKGEISTKPKIPPTIGQRNLSPTAIRERAKQRSNFGDKRGPRKEAQDESKSRSNKSNTNNSNNNNNVEEGQV